MQHQKWYQNLRIMLNQQLYLPVLSGVFHIYDFDYIDNTNWYVCPQHKHSFYEFVYCLSGTVHILLEDTDFFLLPGEILFLPKELFHQLSLVPKNASLLYCNFDFNVYTDDALDRNTSIQPLRWCIDEEYELISNLLDGDFCTAFDDGSCKKELDSFITSIVRHYVGDYIILNNYFTNFIVSMIQSFYEHKVSDTFQSDFNATVPSLRHSATIISKYIQENYNRDLTVEKIADELNYSKRHIQRIIQNYFGISISQLVKNYRVAKVQTLLQQDSLTLEEIAAQTGYHDVKRMTRNFKDLTGKTVTEYRLQILQKKQEDYE